MGGRADDKKQSLSCPRSPVSRSMAGASPNPGLAMHERRSGGCARHSHKRTSGGAYVTKSTREWCLQDADCMTGVTDFRSATGRSRPLVQIPAPNAWFRPSRE